MSPVLWRAIAFTLIAIATAVSYVEYQSGTLHNDRMSVISNRPD